MKDEYITEVVLSKDYDSEPVKVFRLVVKLDDARPFFILSRVVSGDYKQPFWRYEGHYYALGRATKDLARKALYDSIDNDMKIKSISYTQTAIIVKDLKDFYSVDKDGKVRQIR